MVWTWDAVPSLDGKVVIVTGANSGIGFHAARHFAKHNARVILACRSEQRGKDALTLIQGEFPSADVKLVLLDLSSQKNVKAFPQAFKEVTGEEKVDILLNNAGVMMPPHTLTEDGFELQLATNHLGHFTLTAGLLPYLKKAEQPRIVNVSSMAHRRGAVRWDDIHWKKEGEYSKLFSYAQSKVANLLFTRELGHRLKSHPDPDIAKIVVVAAHPGWTSTNLQFGGNSFNHHWLTSSLFSLGNFLFAQKTEMGAAPLVYAATDPDALNDMYYGPRGIREIGGWPMNSAARMPYSQNDEEAAKLWEVSEDMVGLKFFANA